MMLLMGAMLWRGMLLRAATRMVMTRPRQVCVCVCVQCVRAHLHLSTLQVSLLVEEWPRPPRMIVRECCHCSDECVQRRAYHPLVHAS